jgi:hypothetical protein
MWQRIERILCSLVLIAALAVAVAGCAGNAASEEGWHDHNLDAPPSAYGG